MKKMNLLAAFASLLLISNLAIGQVSLNTGYNNGSFAPYPPPPSTATTQDQYWINIGSSPNTTPPVGPSWVIQGHPAWATAFTDTNWISARQTYQSAAGVTLGSMGYTIFRKCFCLLPGYKDAKLNLKIRADDAVGVWLNSVGNQVLPLSWGNFSPNLQPLSASTSSGFRVGKNCVYVAVLDVYGVATGFDLTGDVNAAGLLPVPAAGVNQSFEPCACRRGPAGAASTMRVDDDDRQAVSEIVKIAEARRAAKGTRLFEGEPPKLEVTPEGTNPIKRPRN